MKKGDFVERLTRKIEGGIDAFDSPMVGTYELIDDTPGLANAKARYKLGRYEDAEEQGWLVELPCRVNAKSILTRDSTTRGLIVIKYETGKEAENALERMKNDAQ
jgi:hypothetical protein